MGVRTDARGSSACTPTAAIATLAAPPDATGCAGCKPRAGPAPASGGPGAAPAAGAAKPSVTGAAELPGEKEFNSCKKLPAGKRIVKLNLKPETEVIDLIGWTLKHHLFRNFWCPSRCRARRSRLSRPSSSRPRRRIGSSTPRWTSVGLTVEPSGKFLRIVETTRARFSNLPFVGANERMPHDKRFVTKLVRVTYLDTNDLTNAVLNRLKSEAGDIISYRSSLIISDQAENIESLGVDHQAV